MDSAPEKPRLTKDLLLVELQNGVNWLELERIYAFTDEDVREWCATDDKFARAYRKIPKVRDSRNKTLEIRIPNWQVAFLDAFKGLGTKATISGAVRELNKAGVEISASTVYARLSPKSNKYDPDFEAAVVELEAERVAPIEDTLIAQMQEGEVPGIAFKYLQGHPMTRNRFAPPEMTLNVNRRSLEVKVLEVRSEFREQFVRQSHKRFGRAPEQIVEVQSYDATLPGIEGHAARVESDAPAVEEDAARREAEGGGRQEGHEGHDEEEGVEGEGQGQGQEVA